MLHYGLFCSITGFLVFITGFFRFITGFIVFITDLVDLITGFFDDITGLIGLITGFFIGIYSVGMITAIWCAFFTNLKNVKLFLCLIGDFSCVCRHRMQFCANDYGIFEAEL